MIAFGSETLFPVEYHTIQYTVQYRVQTMMVIILFLCLFSISILYNRCLLLLLASVFDVCCFNFPFFFLFAFHFILLSIFHHRMVCGIFKLNVMHIQKTSSGYHHLNFDSAPITKMFSLSFNRKFLCFTHQCIENAE